MPICALKLLFVKMHKNCLALLSPITKNENMHKNEKIQKNFKKGIDK